MLPERPKVTANPSSGGTMPAGKSDAPDANLGLHACTAASVRDAKEETGVAAKCIDNQVGSNGNPKKRDSSIWGLGQPSTEAEKLFK